MKKICEECLKEVECSYNERLKKQKIDNNEIEFTEKYYVCHECGNSFYDDLFDENIKEANEAIRKKNNIITIKEIEQILKKYSIGKKTLSLVLGLGEITITRYLNGQNPQKNNSELLKAVLENPFIYELFLIANKDKITDIAYKKSLSKTKQIELNDSNSKLYQIALYVIKNNSDITPLALQKVLYFINGFSKKIFKQFLFLETAQAWKYGPVYKDIYDCFSYFKGNKIDYTFLSHDHEFNLTEEEKDYLDKMNLIFGCYSGEVLREMSHLTEPYKIARMRLKEEDYSNETISLDDMEKYFNDICEKYKINTIEEIKKYSIELFERAIDNLSQKK